MKKELITISLLVALLSSGCHQVLMKMYGFKNPDFESHENIIKFQEKIGFGEFPYVGYKASSWFMDIRMTAPEIYVFNSLGQYIPYRDSLKPNCNGPAEVFVSELNPHQLYLYSDDYTLDTFLELLEGEECKPLEFEKQANIDFYIFMSYSIFSGKKLYREKSILWLEALAQNKLINYRLIMINMDFKDCWPPEQKQLFESRD